MKKILLMTLAASTLALTGCSWNNSTDTAVMQQPVDNSKMMQQQDTMKKPSDKMTFTGTVASGMRNDGNAPTLTPEQQQQMQAKQQMMMEKNMKEQADKNAIQKAPVKK